MSVPHNDDPLLGRTLATFRLDRVIGRGGMATVYYGTDVKLNRPVAVKVIDARYRYNPTYAERFIKESQIVATWRHQNILQIYYADDQDSLYYFAMEYVDGLDLRQLIDLYNHDDSLMPQEDVLRIGYAVADALDYAHTHGVIHRDVKPSNVMVAYSGQVLLTDFGLAMQVTDGSLGEVFGTPHYMAPEQARRSADAVPQSDIYSLAVILFELLTGQVPFDDESPTSVALMHMTEFPPPPSEFNPDLPQPLDEAILHGLEKEPSDRFVSCRQMVKAVHEALSGEKADPDLLPPFPAIIEQATRGGQAGDADVSGGRYLTVAERLLLQEEALDRSQPRPSSGSDIPDETPAQKTPDGAVNEEAVAGDNSLVPLTAVAAVLLIAVAVFMVVRIWQGNGATAAEMVTAQPIAVVEPTVVIDPTEIPPTATLPPPPVSVARPTTAATQEITPAVVESGETLPPEPTPTATSPPPATSTSVPVTNPDLLLIFNNSMAFYVANRTGQTIDISPLSFISLDQDGRMVPYAFRANDWFNFRLESGKCNALEVIEARPRLRPSFCNGFNWVDHPGHSSAQLFWRIRPEEDVNAFQVLWSGQPIQTCPILAGTCAVALPPS